MFLIGLLLFYLLGTSCAASDYNVAIYNGRSGDIIVQPDDTVVEDSIIMLHGEAFNTLNLKEIEDIHYADLFSHVLGLQPFNIYAQREGFPSDDLFNKPKAALLFVMDSVGSEGLKFLSQEDLKRVNMVTSSYPPNVYSLAANLATGTNPSEHGIVGESWRRHGRLVNAYSKDGQALKASVADILSQTWEGKALTISASSSSLSGAFSVHPQLKELNPSWNAYSYSLKGSNFVNLYDYSELSLDIMKLLKSSAFTSFAKVAHNEGNLNADISGHSASFDLDTQEDFALFAELGFVYNLLDTLQSDARLSALAKDDVPDFFSVSFSGLKGIQAKYGLESEKYAVSLLLVDNIVRQAIEKISNIYNNRVATSLVYLHTQVISTPTKDILYQNVRDYLHEGDFERHYPSIFVRNSEVAAVCNLLTEILEHEKVHCVAPTETKNVRMVDNVYATPTNTTTPNNVVPAFWILFWISVVLGLLILSGVLGLVALGDAGKDSLLFRSAGRHLHQS